MKRILCIFIAICFSVSAMASLGGNARTNMDRSKGDGSLVNHLTTHPHWARAILVKQHQSNNH